jgi:hypothetical protein
MNLCAELRSQAKGAAKLAARDTFLPRACGSRCLGDDRNSIVVSVT